MNHVSMRSCSPIASETELMPQSLIKCMDDAVHAFVGDAEQSDDLTMLAIKRPA